MASYTDVFASDTMSAFTEHGATDFYWDTGTTSIRRTLITPMGICLRKTAAVDPTNGWTPQEDQRVRMKYTNSATLSATYGPIIKAQDENNYLRAEVTASLNKLQIEAVIGGVVQASVLNYTSLPAHTGSASYWVEIETVDNTVCARWSSTDPSGGWTYESAFIAMEGDYYTNFGKYEAGRVGFMWQPGSTSHRIDEISLDDANNVDTRPVFDSDPADYSVSPLPYSEDLYPSPSWRVLDASSTFNTALPASPRLHPRSEEICDNLRLTNADLGLGGGPQQLIAANNADFSVPLYFAKSSDDLYTLTNDGRYIDPPDWEHDGVQIRLPDGAEPANGGDAHLGVVQPDGIVWEIYEAVVDHVGHTIEGSAGAKYDSLYQKHVGGTGIGRTEEGGFGPVAGPQIPPITADVMGVAGLIWPEEIIQGEINHALAMLVKEVTWTPNHTYPGRSTALQAADETDKPISGQRFFMDYTDGEIAALDIDDWQKTILTAMARYGMINVDTTNSRWGIRGFINPETFTSFGLDEPMVAYAAEHMGDSDNIVLSAGEYYYRMHVGIDWTRLQACDIAEGQKIP